jgi:hypothetical protein
VRLIFTLVLALLVTLGLVGALAFGMQVLLPLLQRSDVLPNVPPWLPLPMVLALSGLLFYRLWPAQKALLIGSLMTGGLTVGSALALHALLPSRQSDAPPHVSAWLSFAVLLVLAGLLLYFRWRVRKSTPPRT